MVLVEMARRNGLSARPLETPALRKATQTDITAAALLGCEFL
jgi:hypothetical protein